MRKTILAVSASAFGLLVAVAPAAALSSYQIQGDDAASFADAQGGNSIGGLSVTSKTTGGADIDPSTGLPIQNFNQNEQSQQQDLSRDMSWQGTGYYLRPNR